MWRHLLTALKAAMVTMLLFGLLLPLAFTGFARLAFPSASSGSLVDRGGRDVGSRMIGQAFSSARYFHGRPSAGGYDPLHSGASNLGPTSKALRDLVRERASQLRREEKVGLDQRLPVDALTASASGLDPDISPAYAALQVPRVAAARGLSEVRVRELVANNTQRRFLGVFGQDRVHVLELNLALDEESRHAER